jgi:hypothetical protein
MKKIITSITFILGFVLLAQANKGNLVIYKDQILNTTTIKDIQIKIEKADNNETVLLDKKAMCDAASTLAIVTTYSLETGIYNIKIEGTLDDGRKFQEHETIKIYSNQCAFLAIEHFADHRQGKLLLFLDKSMKVQGREIRDIKIYIDSKYITSLSKRFDTKPNYGEAGTISQLLPFGTYNIVIEGINGGVPTTDPHHFWKRQTQLKIDREDTTLFLPISND